MKFVILAFKSLGNDALFSTYTPHGIIYINYTFYSSCP